MKTIVPGIVSTLAALIVGGLAAQPAHPDLNGRVFADGAQPLTGATIFVYTAGPKVGVGTV
jgi:hypothetical protein